MISSFEGRGVKSHKFLPSELERVIIKVGTMSHLHDPNNYSNIASH